MELRKIAITGYWKEARARRCYICVEKRFRDNDIHCSVVVREDLRHIIMIRVVEYHKFCMVMRNYVVTGEKQPV